jgi:aspartate ammonia-lyase
MLGEREIPVDTLYGIQTLRAFENFPLKDRTMRLEIIRGLAQVKIACAQANNECGYLDDNIAGAVISAAEEILEGKHDQHFPLQALQGGAGTSANLNVNEVIASIASKTSVVTVSPLEHVNLHQSTNDVFPTAIKIAALYGFQRLEQALVELLESLQEKEREFADVVKLGRTQLRDAVPITLGREFGAYAGAISRDRWRVFKCQERLRVVNIGATAVGTGIAAPRKYIFLVIEKLRQGTGLGVSRAEDLVEATQNNDPFIEVSGMLRAHAANLLKIARDLRLLSSGPQGGLGEIELPAIQPGSSVMPGKVNPVIPEMVMQVGFRVMALDQEINLAVMSGELELNAFLPLIADALLTSLHLLEQTDRAFAQKCINGIIADPLRCRELMERSSETLTALIPKIGHSRAVELAQQMREENLTVREVVLKNKVLTEDELEGLLLPEKITALGWRDTNNQTG